MLMMALRVVLQELHHQLLSALLPLVAVRVVVVSTVVVALLPLLPVRLVVVVVQVVVVVVLDLTPHHQVVLVVGVSSCPEVVEVSSGVKAHWVEAVEMVVEVRLVAWVASW